MKADFHCHTLNVKDGEKGRKPTFQKFCDQVSKADIGILAITNHNTFDEVQFTEFSSIADCAVCPGIELDMQGTSSR